MNIPKTSTPSSSADVVAKWVDGRNRQRNLTLQDVTGLSEVDLSKVKVLVARYEALPKPRLRAGLLVTRRIYYILNRYKCRKSELEHPENGKRRSRLWYLDNKERNHARTSRNRKLNREKYLETARVGDRKRRRENIQAALRCRLSCRVKEAFRTQSVEKLGSFLTLLGSTVQFAMDHIASQFTIGMEWGIGRTWHVDHIVPISAFDLENWEEACCCFNWKNLRPLWGRENMSKGATLPSPLPSWLPPHIAERITERNYGRTTK